MSLMCKIEYVLNLLLFKTININTEFRWQTWYLTRVLKYRYLREGPPQDHPRPSGKIFFSRFYYLKLKVGCNH